MQSKGVFYKFIDHRMKMTAPTPEDVLEAQAIESATRVCFCGKLALYRKDWDGYCEKHKRMAI